MLSSTDATYIYHSNRIHERNIWNHEIFIPHYHPFFVTIQLGRGGILYKLRPIFIFNRSARIPLLVVIRATWRNKQRLLACTRANPRERSFRKLSGPASGDLVARDREKYSRSPSRIYQVPHREPVRVRSLTKWGSNNNTLGSRAPKIDGARCEWIIW